MEKNIDITIKKLIDEYEWAGINAITFADGLMTLLEINFYSKGEYFIAPIVDSTINSYLKYNSDELSSFDVFSKIIFNNYEILVGDGSGEGNGIIYVINTKNNSLSWFAFFENSEPFKSVTVDENGTIQALSAVNITWKLPIENPLNIELTFPD